MSVEVYGRCSRFGKGILDDIRTTDCVVTDLYIYGYCEQENKIIPIGNSSEIVSEQADDGTESHVILRDFIGSDEACSIGVVGNPASDIQGSAICLGDFDGVHRGHMRLFESAKACGKWGVLLLIRRNIHGSVLTTLAEKLEIIEQCGADYVIAADFSDTFAAKSPEEFAQLLSDTMKIGTAVIGYDYRFGRGAAGDAALLTQLLSQKACVIVADAVTDGDEPIKSTAIRTLVRDGDMSDAARLCGRFYHVRGKIVHGKQNGRKMGFPTANFDISPEKILPPDGVYSGKINNLDAVMNIGKNPTFNGEKRTFEVHIPDFHGDLYGKVLTAEIVRKIRGEISFKNIDELKKQIENDICAARHGKE